MIFFFIKASTVAFERSILLPRKGDQKQQRSLASLRIKNQHICHRDLGYRIDILRFKREMRKGKKRCTRYYYSRCCLHEPVNRGDIILIHIYIEYI